MRNITEIIIHCSAVRPDQTSSARQIDRWHRERGFRCIGYHYVIRRSGEVETGRPISQAGAHTQGHNAHSIGICYEGGLDQQGNPADTRTPQQKEAMSHLVRHLLTCFPGATLHGHREFAAKACPCFDVATIMQSPPSA